MHVRGHFGTSAPSPDYLINSDVLRTNLACAHVLGLVFRKSKAENKVEHETSKFRSRWNHWRTNAYERLMRAKCTRGKSEGWSTVCLKGMVRRTKISQFGSRSTCGEYHGVGRAAVDEWSRTALQ